MVNIKGACGYIPDMRLALSLVSPAAYGFGS